MITGLILAGGKSARMGRNKALIKVGGQSVIQRVADVVSDCCSHVMVVCSSEDDYSFLGVTVIRDLEPGHGPFMGLYSGLVRMETERALAVGCDMPYIKPELARYLAELSDHSEIVVPRIQGFYEPLFATYSKACIDHAKELLESREKRIRMLYERMETRVMEETEIKKFDPDLDTFINLNFPGDLEKIGCNKIK